MAHCHTEVHKINDSCIYSGTYKLEWSNEVHCTHDLNLYLSLSLSYLSNDSVNTGYTDPLNTGYHVETAAEHLISSTTSVR